MNTISTGQSFSAYVSKGGNSSSQEVNATTKIRNSQDSLSIKQGIAVTDAVEIDLSQFTLEKLSDIPVAKFTAPTTSQEYESQLYQQGEERQTGLIRKNGNVIGTISNKGITTFSNSIGNEIYEAGLSANGSVESIQSFLNRQYGGSITVEKFPPGFGPTYAEVHNNVYKESYESLVERQTREYESEQSSNNMYRRVDVTA